VRRKPPAAQHVVVKYQPFVVGCRKPFVVGISRSW